jgi:hypothetical protein
VLRIFEIVIPKGALSLAYFNTREIAAIALFSALWGVINSVFAPVIFQMFGLPILCDMVGFAALTLTFWWVRKFGAATAVGIIATVINFMLNPYGVHFLGFTAASIVFDLVTSLVGSDRIFKTTAVTTVSMLAVSTLSAAFAGLIIGYFFMAAVAMYRWGGIFGWAALHAVGGIIGGFVGVALITGLTVRSVQKIDQKKWATQHA